MKKDPGRLTVAAFMRKRAKQVNDGDDESRTEVTESEIRREVATPVPDIYVTSASAFASKSDTNLESILNDVLPHSSTDFSTHTVHLLFQGS